MGIVNRVPKGFLGLLDAKTQGETPKITDDQLQPIIDLTDNYLADIPFQRIRAQATLSTLNLVSAIVQVPAGELWYVYAASYEAQATANQVFMGNLVFVEQTPGLALDAISLTKAVRDAQTYNAGEGPADGVVFDRPWKCSPGNSFGYVLRDDPGAGNINVTVNVLFRSVQV